MAQLLLSLMFTFGEGNVTGRCHNKAILQKDYGSEPKQSHAAQLLESSLDLPVLDVTAKEIHSVPALYCIAFPLNRVLGVKYSCTQGI